MHWLLGRHVYFPCLSTRFLDSQIPPRSWLKTPLPGLTQDRSLAIVLLPIVLQPLYSSIRLINCLISLRDLLVSESRNLESSSNPNRKVLAAIFFITPTDLIVQFPVSASVAMKVSPASIFIDSSVSTGYGTWLQVINRTSNSWISSAKLWIEPFLNPLNHLKEVGLRLEGNTLHINSLLCVCKDIIWI